MKIKFILISLLFLIGISCKTVEKESNSTHKIKIEWTENLEGDFSFKEKWNYPEYVYKNRFGQLSCDGDCPIEIDRTLMMRTTGSIGDVGGNVQVLQQNLPNVTFTGVTTSDGDHSHTGDDIHATETYQGGIASLV